MSAAGRGGATGPRAARGAAARAAAGRGGAALLAGLLLGAAWLAAPGAARPARACGLCDEDKLAATYDYDLLVRSAAMRHVVVFVRVRAVGDTPAARIAAALRATFARLPGVDAGSVRVSADPLAAAFACDPRRAPPAKLVAAATAPMARAGAAISLLQVMRGPRGAAAPVPAKPAAAR